MTVDYSCDAANKLTFDAWGDTALKTVHAENKGADCGTDATGKTIFNLNGGVVGSKTRGTVDPALTTPNDVANCGYAGTV